MSDTSARPSGTRATPPSTLAAPMPPVRRVRRAGRRTLSDAVTIYLPIILMAVLALGTYWLARNAPALGARGEPRAATHEPDYFMRRFAVRSFDPAGRLKSEVFGREARHYPDTDTLEIDDPRVISYNERGELTVATAKRALSNSDASEVQLFGNAVVTREATSRAGADAQPRMELRGEFLHAFLTTERVTSNQPVTLTRGGDRFTADRLEYDNLGRVIGLSGRVRGTIDSAGGAQP